MNKKVAIAGLIVLMSVGAYAGGPTTLDAPESTALIAAPDPEWQGFYIGANGGYSWRQVHTDFSPTSGIPFNSATASMDRTGGLFGAQVGYDWQFGEDQNVLLGVETDIQKTWVDGRVHHKAVGNGALAGTTLDRVLYSQEQLTWFGTLRPVIGFLTEDNKWLVYITGGMSYGHLEESGDADFRPTDEHNYIASKNPTQVGWVAGAGLEWKFSPNMSAGMQYLYYDLGAVGQNVNAVPYDNAPQQMGFHWNNPLSVGRLDLNYRFI